VVGRKNCARKGKGADEWKYLSVQDIFIEYWISVDVERLEMREPGEERPEFSEMIVLKFRSMEVSKME
jgi:hypothetical protein